MCTIQMQISVTIQMQISVGFGLCGLRLIEGERIEHIGIFDEVAYNWSVCMQYGVISCKLLFYWEQVGDRITPNFRWNRAVSCLQSYELFCLLQELMIFIHFHAQILWVPAAIYCTLPFFNFLVEYSVRSSSERARQWLILYLNFGLFTLKIFCISKIIPKISYF